MDKKSIRNVIGLFSCIIILGGLSTVITQSVISSKKEELYAGINGIDNLTETSTKEYQKDNTNETSAISGPMLNTITKEKYLNDIKLIEEQIDEARANVTESKSMLSAVKYEKGVWEEQFVKIYELYLKEQSFANAEKIRQEQSSFEAERERLALAAAKSASEALDGLAYNKEYVRITKEKMYEYIERYFSED